MRPSLSIALLAPLLLSGCGILGVACNNQCPPGWVHGSVDCGCMQVAKNPGHSGPGSPQPYYVTRRYNCKDVSNGSDRGSCDTTINAASCQEALNGISQKFAQGDPCKFCTNVIDNTREWNGTYTDIQGGPCQEASLHEPITRRFQSDLRSAVCI
jgi:hypothetical protein